MSLDAANFLKKLFIKNHENLPISSKICPDTLTFYFIINFSTKLLFPSIQVRFQSIDAGNGGSRDQMNLMGVPALRGNVKQSWLVVF